MVHKAHRSKRTLDHIVVVHFVDCDGIPKLCKEFPPRIAYRNNPVRLGYKQKPSANGEFVVVSHDNKDYRVFVELGDWRGGKAYRGVAKINKGQPRDNLKVKSSVLIDRDIHECILLIKKKDKITYAEALRQVIEWGLETVEKDYDFGV